MKAVMIMFDTLTRKFLPNYGNEWVQAPTFQKLSEKMLTFDNFYVGSMPCMPARRELHTGKYNFLHRGWGQLEVFDQSIFEILKKNKIYTHLVTDHFHYWEDGGATYHTRYDTFQSFRGQENDRWIPLKQQVLNDNQNPLNQHGSWTEYSFANRGHQIKEEDYSSAKTFQAGVEFIEQYKDEDNWFLQIESFDPHEPFLVPQKYREFYGLAPTKDSPNYPYYQKLDYQANKADLDVMRKEYAALISMVDHHLKKIIDLFDQHNLWADTMLIINTDHGFGLGEHDFVGKTFFPGYDEIIHTPFFLHVPQFQTLAGQRITEVAQTIDIPLTILDHFNLNDQEDRDGKSIFKILASKMKNHEEILFGVNGGHVGIFDGRFIYMRASVHPNNLPLVQYTLNFNFMRNFFPIEWLKGMKLVDGSRYSNGVELLRINLPINWVDSYAVGNLLFDLENDPAQLNNLKGTKVEEIMVKKLVAKLATIACPQEEYERLGLKNNGFN
ncbi:sulfatase [Williamsoniiplasma lucivorax]|uniref:Sulfatase n=1 Tax=Williamsoniiplasma lucivorax TaxID=209274 RepID=A0A2S5RDZ5_9MOLU|nr:sulfatase [Williamsoniiplasma lucivorax]PPE05530.1 sulfatase [Williamsoniiplasma lucivorax]